LWLLALSSAAAFNAWLGFLGLIFGQYRSENPRPKFRSFYQSKKNEVAETWKSGDKSIAVAFAIFAIAGVALGLLFVIGGAGKPHQPSKQVRVISGDTKPH
jgi:hypothetical protein